MSLLNGISVTQLNAIMANPGFAAQPKFQVQQQQQPLATAGDGKVKRKAPSASQKREKDVLTILDGKDTYGLRYAGLLRDFTIPDLEKFVQYVKLKNGRA